ncbi:hypothetical protein FRC12_003996 [Ceratobasidium sp. 428]|nr:hypothetical protein FRC12_003996 [Ceratobasidium sp. 428]
MELLVYWIKHWLTQDSLLSGVFSAISINAKFTIAESQRQTEQLRQFLIQAPRLRYLCIRRPALDSNPNHNFPLYLRDLQRLKSTKNPFPLRSAHFQHPASGTYLSNLTHLGLCGLSIHPLIFAYLPQLTHLKLSLDEHHDPYTEVQALEFISAAKGCKLQGFEIGMYVVARNTERLLVVDACVTAWPELEIFNMFSLVDGKVLRSITNGENLARTVRALAASMAPARKLKQLSIGLVPLNTTVLPPASAPSNPEPSETATPGSLAAIASIFRTACPEVELFRCLAPLPQRSRNELAPGFEVARAKWEGSGWSCGRGDLPKSSTTIFGML